MTARNVTRAELAEAIDLVLGMMVGQTSMLSAALVGKPDYVEASDEYDRRAKALQDFVAELKADHDRAE